MKRSIVKENMMIYEIMNREDAALATAKPDAPITAIISIADPGAEPNSFQQHTWLLGILHLYFYDVEDYEQSYYKCISEEQASE